MRKRKNNFQQSPVFGKVFVWDWHKRLSLAVLVIYLVTEIYFAGRLTAGNMSGALWLVIYTATFPLLWIWFAEYLEDFLSELAWLERLKIPLESVIKFFGWLFLLALLGFSLAKFWSPTE